MHHYYYELYIYASNFNSQVLSMIDVMNFYL